MLSLSLCVCVCEREREGGRERGRSFFQDKLMEAEAKLAEFRSQESYINTLRHDIHKVSRYPMPVRACVCVCVCMCACVCEGGGGRFA